MEIALTRITVSPSNIRKDLSAGTEDTSLQDLMSSIREHGLINPVMVVSQPDGGYELIAGQRRYRACQRLGWETIAAVVRNDLDPTDATILSLVENVHRADLNPIDKAHAYQAIYDRCGSYTRVAQQTAVSVPTVTRYMSLLNLAPAIQERVSTNEGPAGIGTLHNVAKNFASEDQERVLGKIKGLNQNRQAEIIKRSGGDPDRVGPLVEAAVEGEFDYKVCRDRLCFELSDEGKRRVFDLLKEPGYRASS